MYFTWTYQHRPLPLLLVDHNIRRMTDGDICLSSQSQYLTQYLLDRLNHTTHSACIYSLWRTPIQPSRGQCLAVRQLSHRSCLIYWSTEAWIRINYQEVPSFSVKTAKFLQLLIPSQKRLKALTFQKYKSILCHYYSNWWSAAEEYLSEYLNPWSTKEEKEEC